MKYNTNAHKLPSKATKNDFLQTMVNNVVSQLRHKMHDLGMSRESAIAAVKLESCAGSKAWELALQKI